MRTIDELEKALGEFFHCREDKYPGQPGWKRALCGKRLTQDFQGPLLPPCLRCYEIEKATK